MPVSKIRALLKLAALEDKIDKLKGMDRDEELKTCEVSQ